MISISRQITIHQDFVRDSHFWTIPVHYCSRRRKLSHSLAVKGAGAWGGRRRGAVESSAPGGGGSAGARRSSAPTHRGLPRACRLGRRVESAPRVSVQRAPQNPEKIREEENESKKARTQLPGTFVYYQRKRRNGTLTYRTPRPSPISFFFLCSCVK